MKGMLIPTNGNPVEIDIKVDEEGSTLHDLQRLVGGNIEPFDVIFGEGISLYVNEEGLFTCPPNRAVYATKGMEAVSYTHLDVYKRQGTLVLHHPIIALKEDMKSDSGRTSIALERKSKRQQMLTS